MSQKHYDYIIVGNGLAGLQLALAFARDSYFNHKSIALIDASSKTENDKTWSFWEQNNSTFSNLAYQSWQHATIFAEDEKISLNLKPYSYKSIRSIDFYTEAKAQLNHRNNITYLIETVTSVNEKKIVEVTTETNSYTANHVFDSRIQDAFFNDKKSTTLIQHFKGWIIETEDHAFNENSFTMMDYRLKDNNQTTFMYVLPHTKNRALVEFTYFTENIVKNQHYDTYLKQYISEYLHIKNYKIVETEIGQIPMTTFKFEAFNTSKVTKIGTAGGWVKASTGYSFKLTEKKVAKIIENIKSNQIATKGLFKSKYKFFDKVFLQVLKDNNEKGEWIFKQFYSKNSTPTIFKFLDEESSLIEDIKIMWSLFSFSFIKAFFKTL
jgi:lycopene beta-cyclase